MHPISLGLFGSVLDFNKMNFLFGRTMSFLEPQLEKDDFQEMQPGVYGRGIKRRFEAGLEISLRNYVHALERSHSEDLFIFVTISYKNSLIMRLDFISPN